MKKSIIAAAATAGVVRATCDYPPPLSNQLAGNSVTAPSLASAPTVGQPYSILYDGSGLSDSITLILLNGPSTNIQYYETIVAGTANTGSYSWTPECSITPSTTGWGILLQDDSTCKFQWSTQFGIQPDTAGVCSSSSSAPPASSTEWPTSSGEWPPPASSTSDCEESSSTPAPPQSWSTSWETWNANGTWGGPGGKPSTSTYWVPAATGTGAASPTYTPYLSNDGTRFGMSIVGALGAVAAALMLM